MKKFELFSIALLFCVICCTSCDLKKETDNISKTQISLETRKDVSEYILNEVGNYVNNVYVNELENGILISVYCDITKNKNFGDICESVVSTAKTALETYKINKLKFDKLEINSMNDNGVITWATEDFTYGTFIDTMRDDTVTQSNYTVDEIKTYFNSIDVATISIDTDTTSIELSDEDIVRNGFTLILNEFEGGIISINPAPLDNGKVSWNIIEIVVPDSWYYLEDYEKERYCENIGELVKSALATGNMSDVVQMRFLDIADKEVAVSKVLGGYKIN